MNMSVGGSLYCERRDAGLGSGPGEGGVPSEQVSTSLSSGHMETAPSPTPWTDRLTDVSENITLPHSVVGGTYADNLHH